MTQHDLSFQNIFGYNETPFLMTDIFGLHIRHNDFVMKVFVLVFADFMCKLISLRNFKLKIKMHNHDHHDNMYDRNAKHPLSEELLLVHGMERKHAPSFLKWDILHHASKKRTDCWWSMREAYNQQ